MGFIHPERINLKLLGKAHEGRKEKRK